MIMCRYFFLCDRPAIGLAPMPAVTGLGPVPCCARCADKLDLALDPITHPNCSNAVALGGER